MVADGTSSTDHGGDFVFQIKVGMDHEASQVTARHFALPIDRHQRKGTTRSTEKGGDYPTQEDFGGYPTATTTRVAAREEAAISRQQRGTASTEQSKQFDPGGEVLIGSFLPSGYVIYCMLCCALDQRRITFSA